MIGHDWADVAVMHPDEAPEAYARTWQPVDLSTVLDGTWEAPEPCVGARTDHIGLFYPGKQHTVISETEGGKTWLALSACIDEMLAGNHVLYIDFEDSEGGIVKRILDQGISADVIREFFHYIRPSEALGTGINLDDLTAVLEAYKPTIGIIDGITEGMGMHGLDPLSNKDVAAWGRMVPKRIADSGAAAVSLDHVVKDREGRGRYAMGGVHKLNGLDGAAYILENRTPMGVGVVGKSTIRIAKDRPGQLRRHALASKGLAWFGDLVVDCSNGFPEVTIEPPVERTEDWRPTTMMQRISDFLAGRDEAASKKIIELGVTGKVASIRDALGYLIVDGYVSENTPHTLLKPFVDGGK